MVKIKHNSDKCTSSKNSLQLFYDKEKDRWTGFCFSCEAKGLDAYVSKPFEDGDEVPSKPKEKTREEIEAELSEVTQLKLVDIDHRGIPKEYFKKYKVRVALSEFDGKTPASFAFPRSGGGKLKSYKFKTLKQKYQWMVGEGKGCDLIGWERAKSSGNKRLYITEGEWDWLSLEYLLDKFGGDKYSGKYAVTSLPDGAGSAAIVINRMLPEIKKYFDEVVLVFDNDDEGRHAVREVQKVYPEVLTAPPFVACKDANDVLQNMTDKGKEMFIKGVLWNSKKPTLEGVVNVAEILSRGDIISVRGLSYPWPTIDEALQGQTFGDAGVIAGGVGSGKTAIVHELIAHNTMVHGVPCFAALLEEDNRKSVRNICSKIDSIPYNNPQYFENNKERCYETARQLQNKVLLWNSAGNTTQRFDMGAIVAAIRYNYHEYGVKFAYIDNMTKLVDGLDSSKANEFINRWSSELSNLASELNIRIELLSHLNAPIKGIDHEHGGEVKLSQLTGSKGIMRNFSVGIGFERNQYATGGREQNSLMRILKNREHSVKPVAKTQYSLMTGRLLEFNWEGDSLVED